MKGYIYQIINITNGHRYIGQTTNIDKRIQDHFRDLKNNHHHSIKLQRAFNKYGFKNFKFEHIEYEINSIDELYKLEIETIKKYNSYYDGYNCTLGGEGNRTVIDYYTATLIYHICLKYSGVNRQIARYFNCDHTVINEISKNKIYETNNYSEKDLKQLIEDLRLKDNNLNENYKPNNNKKLSKQDVFYILAVCEFNNNYRKTCAQVFNITSPIIANIINKKTYKEESSEYDNLPLEVKRKLNDEAFNKYKLKQVYGERSRRCVKNALTQEQVDYILDNKGKKTQVQIGLDLGISKDRVSTVIRGISYKDLIENYQNRRV